MRQLFYASRSTGSNTQDVLAAILQQSRHNNALDGVTGLLWADAHRFMQVIEGPEESISETYQRIEADARHHDLIVLQDRSVKRPEFGEWSMAYRCPDDRAGDYEDKVVRLLSNATEATRARFAHFIQWEVAEWQ